MNNNNLKKKTKNKKYIQLNPKTLVRHKYKKDYLSQVIARIDFTAPINISEKGPNQKIINSIKKEFPIPERIVTNKSGVVFMDGKAKAILTENHEWIYNNRNRDCSIKISNDGMLIEYQKYKSYEHLKDNFINLSNVIFDEIDNLQVKRLGLRYIDKLDLPNENDPTNWEKYLMKDLLSIFNLADDKTTISRAFHSLELNYGDWYVHFQYGMNNPDYPAPIRRKLFILDTDVHCNLLLEKDDISQWLDKFHDKAILCFEEVITNELRKIMGVKK